ncbi:MAG: polymerase, sigma-24 subunit, subfamily [Verrucomicrobiales bacterium]|nr:polymerase, sigma-24 subunit, subfamily [Verrucomicrobiales bacterium]
METSEYEKIVNACYTPLFRFAYSLTRRPAEAADLTQEAFSRLVANNGVLRDQAKARTWLFTTAYRAFLQTRRHEVRFPEVELLEVDNCLPISIPEMDVRLDSATALEALLKLEDVFRIPVTLFYLDQHSYQEIADILAVPMGTVMSRIARGKALLRDQLLDEPRPKVVRNKCGIL